MHGMQSDRPTRVVPQSDADAGKSRRIKLFINRLQFQFQIEIGNHQPSIVSARLAVRPAVA
jgi:hypothetical protein